MELAGRAFTEARPAGRDQIHLYAHQRTPVQVLDQRPGHLDDIALCLMTCHTRGGRVPAIARRMAARTTQPSEPRTEPVTDTNIDKRRPTHAAEPVDALFPRDQATLRRRIQMMPRRPRKIPPMRTFRISVALPFRHLRIFPGLQPLRQDSLSMPAHWV